MAWLQGISPAWLANGPAIGLLIMIFIAVIRGWLLPRATHVEMLKLHAERLTEERNRGDQWKTAWEAERQRADEQEQQFKLVLESARTTNAMIESLKALVEPRHNPPTGGGRR
jgi:hypothetical protein